MWLSFVFTESSSLLEDWQTRMRRVASPSPVQWEMLTQVTVTLSSVTCSGVRNRKLSARYLSVLHVHSRNRKENQSPDHPSLRMKRNT